MRRWQRAPLETKCGACGLTIARGEPMQLIVLPELKSPKRRCVGCADVAAPDDLPVLGPIPTPIEARPKLRPLAELAQDWKAKAAGS